MNGPSSDKKKKHVELPPPPQHRRLLSSTANTRRPQKSSRSHHRHHLVVAALPKRVLGGLDHHTLVTIKGSHGLFCIFGGAVVGESNCLAGAVR